MGNTEKEMIKAGTIYVDVSYYVSMIYCIYVGKRGITRTRNRTLGISTIENGVLYFSAYYKMNQLKPSVYTVNFVISRKVISLPKVIKYVKRSKYSFHDFSTKHIRHICAPLN